DPFLWGTFALAALLIFTSLDGRGLWQDEAETGLLARSILRDGIPRASDGVNVVSQLCGEEFGPDYVWRFHPWLQFYVAAAGITLGGPTTLAARIPFAILGLCVMPLLYWTALRLFSSRLVARLGAAYLTLSVPFLLHVRQARWHALAYLL